MAEPAPIPVQARAVVIRRYYVFDLGWRRASLTNTLALLFGLAIEKHG